MHRPRHGGRQLTALSCALVFFATPVFSWMFGARAGEIENHKLASFPSIADGWGMFTGLPAWATDHLVFRAAAIQAADGVSRGVFGEPAPLDQGNREPSGPLPGSPSPQDGEQGEDAPQAGSGRVLEGKNDWLYFGMDVESKCAPGRPLNESVQQLNKLRDAVTDSGRKFVLTVTPDKSTMVPQNLPDSYPGKDCARAASEKLWPEAIDNGGAIDLRPALRAAADRLHRPVYFKQDTHWTDEGSLEMVRALAENIKPGSTATWNTPESGMRTSTADLTMMMGRPADKRGMSYELRPDGFTDRTGELLRNLNRPVHRKSDSTIGTIDERTTVLGDSFTKVASRYLPAAFTDLTMLHYNSITDDARVAAKSLADSEIVVVQIVERSLASGNAPILDQGFINEASAALQPR
ncbi:MAG: hypothetical protein GEU98_23090 [Pseudonocardiaceae bacterium]|nr:hypothetical protein [Pseudonocardiaceae bacterium]